MLCLEVCIYSEAGGFNHRTNMMRFPFFKAASDGSVIDGMKESKSRSRITDRGAMAMAQERIMNLELRKWK